MAEQHPWADCGVGCQYLPHNPGIFRGYADEDGRAYYAATDQDGGYETYVLMDHDGQLLGIWQTSHDRPPNLLCAIDTIAVGGGRAAVVGHVWINGDPVHSRGYVWVAPIADIGNTIAPAFSIPADVNSLPQNLWVSATHVVVQTSLGLLYMSDGTTMSDPIYVDVTDGPAQDGYLHDSHFFYEDWQDQVRLAVYEWGMPHASILYDATPADVRSFEGSGTDLAWLDCFDYSPVGGCSRTELWTSTYATSAATLAPRRVEEIPVFLTRGAGGGGWYTKQSSPGVDLWSLSDGTHRVWNPPSGTLAGRPQYALPHEVMVLTNTLPYRFDPTILPIVP